MEMEAEVDHYKVLGLPGGVKGSKITQKEIRTAYKAKALELHPDKRPHDPNGRSDFQKLQRSYEILKDERSRKLFDDLLKHQQRVPKNNERKRKTMVDDLKAWTRAAEQELDRLVRLREEAERLRAMHANKRKSAPATVDSFWYTEKLIPWKNTFGEDCTAIKPVNNLFSKIVK